MQMIYTHAGEIGSIMGLARRMAGRYGRVGLSDLDDIVQDTMLRVLAKRDGRPICNAWLRKAVRSAACDAGRKHTREAQYLYAPDSTLLGARVCELADEVGTVQLNGRKGHMNDTLEPDLMPDISRVLEQLKPAFRQVLALSAHGASYQEIANMTGAKLGTVRSRLHYARRKAKSLLGDLV